MKTLALILSVTCGMTAAADPFATNLTLRAALNHGAEHNPLLGSAFNQWKGAEESITARKGLPDPTFTYGYYFEPVETRTGPQNQRFGISQTLPGFGKLSARRDIATSRAAVIGQNYRTEKLNLDQRIAESYAELHYLKRSIEITRERAKLVQDLENVATARYKAGVSMGPTLQAQLELGRLEERVESLTDLRRPREARMNAALNRAPDAPLAWPESIPYQKIDVDFESLKSELARANPELAALAAGVEQGDHQLRLAKRERLPDITLGLQYIETGDAAAPVADSGKDPIIGTIGFNIPLWLGKNRARVEAAAYQKTASQLALDYRARALEADLRGALFELRDADRKIELYTNNLIPKATQSLEVNRKAFESGRMEFINLIDAQRALLEFELARERALADHLIARANLSRLSGVDFLTGAPHETR